MNLLVTSVQNQQTIQGHQLRPVRGSTYWTALKELNSVSLYVAYFTSYMQLQEILAV